jgi:anti-sigma28 factor (negative regulator of flagellin synthesis)
MSQINNVAGNTPVQRVTENPVLKQVPSDAPTQMRAVDKLELSGASHLLAALKSNDVRTGLVSEIRNQIQDGSYDADGKKLDGAVDKVLDELNR